MKTDPGLESIRKARTRISHEHGNDPRRLVTYYMEYQRRFAGRLRWARDESRKPREAAEQADPADDAPRRG